MRLTTTLLIATLLLATPLVLADPPREDTIEINTDADAEAELYVTLCRLHLGDDGVVGPPERPVQDCAVSGVYEETNNVHGLQTRAGTHNGQTYAPDAKVPA